MDQSELNMNIEITLAGWVLRRPVGWVGYVAKSDFEWFP